ncbi:MAG: hypothetical protein II746_10615, partial [Bacteroidaceae bacterium]|nr:hypothetical protein [Bacteroidaceae bacterium]
MDIENTARGLLTAEEMERFEAMQATLTEKAGEALQDGDEERLKGYLKRVAESDKAIRDAFGLSPLLTDMETACLVAEEIGATRG